MTNFRLPLIAACALLVATSGISAADRRGEEPAQNATVVIDNQEFAVVAGQSASVKIDGKPKTVRVKISPFREFYKAGVKFRYESQRHFSYDKLSEQVDHWSLDGNNTIIMVQHYKVAVGRKAILQEFEKQFRAMKAGIKSSSTKLRHKNGTLKGDRLDIKLGNVNLSQEIFVIPGKKDTRTFILQDTITGSGKNTSEYKRTKKLIEKSLNI